MLKKLYLYDMRALSRFLFPILLVFPVTGIVMLSLSFLIRMLSRDSLLILVGSLEMIYLFCFLGMALALVAVTFFILFRYYKNFFSDEGYLTFTIPTSAETLLSAKILSGASWMALAGLACGLSLFVATFLPSILIRPDEANFYITEMLPYLWKEYWLSFRPVELVAMLLSSLLSFFSEIIIFYTGITLGSLIMRRHKIFGSILFFLLVNAVISFINSLVSGLVDLSGLFFGQEELTVMVGHLISIVLSIATFFGGFFLISFLLNKKLDLE